MNREIKFRCWDVNRNQMVYEDNIIRYNVNPLRATRKDTAVVLNTLMQYTGLKDKNGVEIYEGDIVQLQESYVKPIAVYWNKEMTGFYPIISHRPHAMTVIGNIFQNKDLINI